MKERKIVEKNTVLLEKIVEIRHSTGLNQEAFYSKYLQDSVSNSLNSGSSVQGFMRDLERGYKLFPAYLLPVYSSIGKCDLSAFFVPAASASNATQITMEDICHSIIDIDKQHGFDFHIVEEAPDGNDEDYYSEAGSIDVKLQNRQRVWLSLSPHIKGIIVDRDNDDVPIYSDYDSTCACVNKFLLKYFKLKQASRDIIETLGEDGMMPLYENAIKKAKQ